MKNKVIFGFHAVTSRLRDEADADEAARALLSHLPPARLSGEPVVCMAHGTRRDAKRLYECWGEAVARLDPNVYVACMKGRVTLDSLLPLLKARAGERVWLLPLLSVVGKHTLQDMAGDGPQSWKHRLEQAGFVCSADLRGLADGPFFAELWMRRLDKAVSALDA